MVNLQKSIPYVLATILLISIVAILLLSFEQTKSSISDNTVTRVIDGDTLVLATGERVRLICINTPEIGSKGSYGAKEFLEILVLNKQIRLEKDISETDKYGRLLRYIWVNNTKNEEIFINKELVQQGYASVWRYGEDVKRCNEIGGK